VANDLAAVSSVLTKVFAPLTVRTANRRSLMLRLLQFRKGSGTSVQWAQEFTGAGTNAGAIADGSDAVTESNDARVPATLNWAVYSDTVKQSGLAVSAAATTMSPEDLRDLMGRDVENSANALASKVNKDFYTQASSAAGKLPVTAIDSAIAATGTYAGIDRGTYTGHAANVSLNSGTKRALTLSLMRSIRRQIFVAGGETDLIVCDPVTFDYYGALMDPQRHYVDQIRTAKGPITLDPGWRALEFEGIPVLRDKDAPAGTMYMYDTKYIYWQYLPDATVPGFPKLADMIAKGDDKEPGSLPIALLALARTGDATKIMIKSYFQLVVERSNAQGVLGDLLVS
jgi:hypothetical protein